MAGLPIEKLRSYLSELAPGSQALLINELERGILRGDELPAAEVILQELRRAARDAGRPAQRIGNLARLFFQPLEPFLVDGPADRQHQGRITRASLEPIWQWISRDLIPAEAAAVSAEVAAAIAANEIGRAEQLTRNFQDRAALRMQEAMDIADADEKALMRLSVQVGTPRALDDARAVLGMLKARAALEAIGDRLPAQIRNFAGEQLDQTKALLDSPLCRDSGILPYALVMVMGRLASRGQLIRLAVKAAGSDLGARVAATPYAIAVTIAIAETEGMVRELTEMVRSGRGVAISALLKDIHDAARGLRTELDLGNDSPWARRLAALRSDISNLLKDQIESMPGRVRRLLRPRPPKDVAPGSTLSPGEVEDIEALVALVATCRHYAGELAISEMTQRAFGELQQYLDATIPLLIDTLRRSGETDRKFLRSQIDAAIRICAKVFGDEHAAVLRKAADIACRNERKVVGMTPRG